MSKNSETEVNIHIVIKDGFNLYDNKFVFPDFSCLDAMYSFSQHLP